MNIKKEIKIINKICKSNNYIYIYNNLLPKLKQFTINMFINIIEKNKIPIEKLELANTILNFNKKIKYSCIDKNCIQKIYTGKLLEKDLPTILECKKICKTGLENLPDAIVLLILKKQYTFTPNNLDNILKMLITINRKNLIYDIQLNNYMMYIPSYNSLENIFRKYVLIVDKPSFNKTDKTVYPKVKYIKIEKDEIDKISIYIIPLNTKLKFTKTNNLNDYLNNKINDKYIYGLNYKDALYVNRIFIPIYNLTNLTTITNFDQPIDSLVYLKKLTYLQFGQHFDKDISLLNNLHNLTYLQFGEFFDKPIDSLNNLHNLTYLYFGEMFNKPIDSLNNLGNLKTIVFGRNFNQPIDSLKKLTNLTYLYFGRNFNQPVNSLNGLTNLLFLHFDFNFNHSIENFNNLKELKTLIFGTDFNKSIDNLNNLINLKKIILDSGFKLSLDNLTNFNAHINSDTDTLILLKE